VSRPQRVDRREKEKGKGERREEDVLTSFPLSFCILWAILVYQEGEGGGGRRGKKKKGEKPYRSLSWSLIMAAMMGRLVTR